MALSYPAAVLMCEPRYFDVVDVKNEFMRANVGAVDHDRARLQWETLAQTFRDIGVTVHTIPAEAGCEDMVFTANPSFCARTADGEAVAVLGRMAFPSRQPEVDAHAAWYRAHGIRIAELPPNITRFESGGDIVPHPGRSLFWAAAGPRTERAAHEALATVYGVPVLTVELAGTQFYHLDTCFAAIDESTVLVYSSALTSESLELIRRHFSRVIDVSGDDAMQHFACNAAAFFGKAVVLQRGATETARTLNNLGYEVLEVDTGEFMKSGGSVYCMKSYLP